MHLPKTSTNPCGNSGEQIVKQVQRTMEHFCHIPCGRINCERFRGFLELISRFEFDFCRCGNYIFMNDSNFGCVQSSITRNVAVHVPVLWLVCAHAIPSRMFVVSSTTCIYIHIFIDIVICERIQICICICICICIFYTCKKMYIFLDLESGLSETKSVRT